MAALLIPAAISAGVQLISRLFGKSEAEKQKEKESARIDKEYGEMEVGLKRGYKGLRDTQLGQTSIDPEAQLAYNTNEKATANAISRVKRSATTSNEAISAIAGITNNRVLNAQRISAAEGARRRIAAENAEKTGLASEQAIANLKRDKQAAKRGAYSDVNTASAYDTDFLAGIGTDIAQAALYDKAFSAPSSTKEIPKKLK